MLGGADGFLKLIFDTATLKLLGVHAFGEGATEIVHIGQVREGKRCKKRLKSSARRSKTEALVLAVCCRDAEHSAAHRHPIMLVAACQKLNFLVVSCIICVCSGGCACVRTKKLRSWWVGSSTRTVRQRRGPLHRRYAVFLQIV